jgi:hypothetical protein
MSRSRTNNHNHRQFLRVLPPAPAIVSTAGGRNGVDEHLCCGILTNDRDVQGAGLKQRSRLHSRRGADSLRPLADLRLEVYCVERPLGSTGLDGLFTVAGREHRVSLRHAPAVGKAVTEIVEVKQIGQHEAIAGLDVVEVSVGAGALASLVFVVVEGVSAVLLHIGLDFETAFCNGTPKAKNSRAPGACTAPVGPSWPPAITMPF